MVEYTGDDNARLKWIQRATSWELVDLLYDVPRRFYLDAARLFENENAITGALDWNPCANRTALRRSYELIAARFRFDWDDQQIQLFDELIYDEHYRQRWSEYFRDHAEQLARHSNDHIIKALAATMSKKPSEALAGELRLASLLKRMYGISRRECETLAERAAGMREQTRL